MPHLICPIIFRKAVRRVAALAALIAAWPALAQQQPVQPAPTAPAPSAAPQQFQQSPEWSKMARMQLERQFAGPLQDTVIQRWRDPVDGTICYIYLPISVQHSPTSVTGFVQYGPNSIGSINCIPPNPPAPPAPAGRK